MEGNALKEATEALEVVRAYQSVFSTPQGEIVLKDLAQKCFMGKSVADISQPVLSVFNDGKRCAFLDILNMINASEAEIVCKINKMKGS